MGQSPLWGVRIVEPMWIPLWDSLRAARNGFATFAEISIRLIRISIHLWIRWVKDKIWKIGLNFSMGLLTLLLLMNIWIGHRCHLLLSLCWMCRSLRLIQDIWIFVRGLLRILLSSSYCREGRGLEFFLLLMILMFIFITWEVNLIVILFIMNRYLKTTTNVRSKWRRVNIHPSPRRLISRLERLHGHRLKPPRKPPQLLPKILSHRQLFCLSFTSSKLYLQTHWWQNALLLSVSVYY